MKISLLGVKGCLGVKELDFKPGKITLITGAKGTGKTSILESIKKFFTNVGDRPVFVNSDSEKGEIYVVLDDGTKGKKTFSPAGGAPYVNIEKDGMKPKSPEKFLKSLISDAQINPISFIGLSEKEQTETILGTIPMFLTKEKIEEIFGEVPDGIDIGKHALKLCKDLESLYSEQRRSKNSDIKSYAADISSTEAKLPQGYDAEIWRDAKVTDVMVAINEANDHNKYIANCNSLITQTESQKQHVNELLASKVEAIQAEIDRLTATIQEVKGKAVEDVKLIEEKSEKAKQWLEKNEAIDIQPLQDKAEEIEAMKGFVVFADDLKQKRKDLAKAESESEFLTRKIELARKQPEILLKSASMPIEGLGIDSAGNIVINGRPIKNLSDGEKIEFALNIAKATAGELKLILINGFEALDTASQKAFIDSAKEDEYQYIITCVADGELKITTD